MKNIILGIDAWYPQVDGVTNTVLNYCARLKKLNYGCNIIAPSYGRNADLRGLRLGQGGGGRRRGISPHHIGLFAKKQIESRVQCCASAMGA